MNKTHRIGVSIHSIVIQIAFQLVLFVYFFDLDSITRSTGQLLCIGLEMYKLYKLCGFQHNKMIQKGEHVTQHLDAMALKYLTYSVPFLYIICNTLYQYSLVDFLNQFGDLIVIVPQLYINYNMNTVHHVSFHTIMYKCVNTGIGTYKKKIGMHQILT